MDSYIGRALVKELRKAEGHLAKRQSARNSHVLGSKLPLFPYTVIGDDPIVGVYIPIIRIPIKGGMTIPNIGTFDHGTYVFEGFFYQSCITHTKEKIHAVTVTSVFLAFSR